MMVYIAHVSMTGRGTRYHGWEGEGEEQRGGQCDKKKAVRRYTGSTLKRLVKLKPTVGGIPVVIYAQACSVFSWFLKYFPDLITDQ